MPEIQYNTKTGHSHRIMRDCNNYTKKKLLIHEIKIDLQDEISITIN